MCSPGTARLPPQTVEVPTTLAFPRSCCACVVFRTIGSISARAARSTSRRGRLGSHRAHRIAATCRRSRRTTLAHEQVGTGSVWGNTEHVEQTATREWIGSVVRNNITRCLGPISFHCRSLCRRVRCSLGYPSAWTIRGRDGEGARYSPVPRSHELKPTNKSSIG